MKERKRSVLFLDDEKSILSALRREIRELFGASIHAEFFASPEEALSRLSERGFDVIVSDQRMPEMDGPVFLTLAKGLAPSAIMVAMSGHCDFKALERAVNEGGISKFMPKPWVSGDLASILEESFCLAETRRAEADLAKAGLALIDSREAAERARLESMEPGITAFETDSNGIGIERVDEPKR